ncbi:hypothetical protein ABRY23_09045 [Melioribacteraceae bacterium 4301-Me]|uniref:hypothetical protein n=1 Tax=Pyranulibacter aquaticus TaxID=3163344 RepID=UPI0035966EEE
MTKEKLADRIKQLINISYTLISFSERLQKLHDKYLPKTALHRHEYKISKIPMLIRFFTLHYLVVVENSLLEKAVQSFRGAKPQIFLSRFSI